MACLMMIVKTRTAVVRMSSDSAIMQNLDGYAIQYPQTPLMPGAYPTMASPFYMPRPLPGAYPQQFPAHMHPFTLAERLAGIVLI